MTLRPHTAFASACGGEECATRTFCILGDLRLVRPEAGRVGAAERTERLRGRRREVKEVKSPQISCRDITRGERWRQ